MYLPASVRVAVGARPRAGRRTQHAPPDLRTHARPARRLARYADASRHPGRARRRQGTKCTDAVVTLGLEEYQPTCADER